MKHGIVFYYFAAYFVIFMFQMLIAIGWYFCITYIFTFSDYIDANAWDYCGVALWVIGFSFEVIGDY